MKTTKKNAAVLKKDTAAETKKVGPSSKTQWDYKKSLLYKKGGSTMKKYQTLNSQVNSKLRDNKEEVAKRQKAYIDSMNLQEKNNSSPFFKINPKTGGVDTSRTKSRSKIDGMLGNTTTGQFKKGGSTHPGFKAVQSSIAKKQGVSKQAAGAILAASTRRASASAKRANPNLKRVKG